MAGMWLLCCFFGLSSIKSAQGRCEEALADQKQEYDAKIESLQQQIDRLAERVGRTERRQMNDVIGFLGTPMSNRYYGNIGDIVVFDKIDFNAGGSFDGSSFVCPQSGMYVFSLSARGSHNAFYEPAVYKNDAIIAQVTVTGETGYESGDGVTVVTQCLQGDVVQVRLFYKEETDAYVIAGYWNVFSGALLQLML